MAHSCPVCGNYCTCGGDIDDCEFDNTPEQMACTCCEESFIDGSGDELEFDDEQNDFNFVEYENQIRCERVEPKS